MNIEELTPEQREALRAQFEAEKAAQAAEREQREGEYKSLVSDTVDALIKPLREASEALARTKTYVVGELATLIGLKQDLYGVRDEQKTHTFTNKAGTFRITIGTYCRDAWDETVSSGEALIRQAIRKLGTDAKTRALVKVIFDLLSKDKAGNLKINSVFRLRKYAKEIQDADFDEGLRIISASYRPERTKIYILAEMKNELNAWVSIPLGMTEAK